MPWLHAKTFIVFGKQPKFTHSPDSVRAKNDPLQVGNIFFLTLHRLYLYQISLADVKTKLRKGAVTEKNICNRSQGQNVI